MHFALEYTKVTEVDAFSFRIKALREGNYQSTNVSSKGSPHKKREHENEKKHRGPPSRSTSVLLSQANAPRFDSSSLSLSKAINIEPTIASRREATSFSKSGSANSSSSSGKCSPSLT